MYPIGQGVTVVAGNLLETAYPLRVPDVNALVTGPVPVIVASAPTKATPDNTARSAKPAREPVRN